MRRGKSKNNISGYSNVEVIIYPNPTGTLRDNNCVITGTFTQSTASLSNEVAISRPCSFNNVKYFMTNDVSKNGSVYFIKQTKNIDNLFIYLQFIELKSIEPKPSTIEFSFEIRATKTSIDDLNII